MQLFNTPNLFNQKKEENSKAAWAPNFKSEQDLDKAEAIHCQRTKLFFQPKATQNSEDSENSQDERPIGSIFKKIKVESIQNNNYSSEIFVYDHVIKCHIDEIFSGSDDNEDENDESYISPKNTPIYSFQDQNIKNYCEEDAMLDAQDYFHNQSQQENYHELAYPVQQQQQDQENKFETQYEDIHEDYILQQDSDPNLANVQMFGKDQQQDQIGVFKNISNMINIEASQQQLDNFENFYDSKQKIQMELEDQDLHQASCSTADNNYSNFNQIPLEIGFNPYGQQELNQYSQEEALNDSQDIENYNYQQHTDHSQYQYIPNKSAGFIGQQRYVA